MKRISVRVPEEVVEDLEEQAKIEGTDRSTVIRQILAQHAGTNTADRLDDLEERVEDVEDYVNQNSFVKKMSDLIDI